MERFKWLIALFAMIWGAQISNLVSGYALNAWLGLVPRSLAGVDGILFMPVLHGSVTHAVSNSLSLAILGGLMAITAQRVALHASAIIVGVGGLGVWAFGKPAIHIGASGLIFGWFAYLVARGFVDKRPIPVLIAAGVALFYGSMIWGVLPGQAGVSWESHLFGAAAGVFASVILKSERDA